MSTADTTTETKGAKNRMLRVLLADESAAVRHKLRHVLQPFAFIEIVGEVEKDNDALNLFFVTRPDVVVASVCLPDHGGFHILRGIQRAAADCAVVLTNRVPNPFVEAAAGLLGAAGVCSPSDGLVKLLGIIENLWQAKLRRSSSSERKANTV